MLRILYWGNEIAKYKELSQSFAEVEAVQKFDRFQKLARKKNDAYLLDEVEVENSPEILSFLKQLKNLENSIIISLVSKQLSMSEFTEIKKISGIDFLFEKPIEEDLLIQILNPQTQATEKLSLRATLPKNLIDHYDRAIFERIVLIEQLIHEFNESKDSHILKSLQSEAHKISGSAASFGYLKLGDECKKLDLFLSKNTRKSEEKAIANFYKKIRNYFQIIST